MIQRILPSRLLLSLLLLLLCTSYGSCAPEVDFQVAQPPFLPKEAKQCTVPIIQRKFASSIRYPEVVQFTPPTDCGTPGSWAGISLHLTVTCDGKQVDDLGIVTFQNIEIWRTSTPESDDDNGVTWMYQKDVTRFIPLFSKPGTFILQLNNSAQIGHTGELAATLEATFFASSSQFPSALCADLIVPLTPLDHDNTGNVASVPPDFSVQVTLPTNAVAAFAEFQASGSSYIGNEGSWYLNVPNQFVADVPDKTTPTPGEGPFREVRVLVDGKVAGAAFPYPAIRPGSFVANTWRPIMPYGSVDLPTYNLDLTPFIPTLTDGKPHTITLGVVSAEQDHQINQNWFLSGLLHVNLDSSNTPTTGKITRYEVSDFATSTVSSSKNGADMDITLNASRSVYIEAEIVAGSGAKTEVVFSQYLDCDIVQSYLQSFTKQNIFHLASGHTLSKHNDVTVLQDDFAYPLTLNLTTSSDGSYSWAYVDQVYKRVLLPAPFILGTTFSVHQRADSNGDGNTTFWYDDTAGNQYTRKVIASHNAITFSNEGGHLAQSASPRATPN